MTRYREKREVHGHARKCELCGAMFIAKNRTGDNLLPRYWRCPECNADPKPADDTISSRAKLEMVGGGRK